MLNRKTILNAAAATALILSGAAAAQALEVGDALGKSEAEIRTTLQGQGFEVRKIDTEDGELEAYALKDGKRLEIYVDSRTGKVTKVKEDD